MEEFNLKNYILKEVIGTDRQTDGEYSSIGQNLEIEPV